MAWGRRQPSSVRIFLLSLTSCLPLLHLFTHCFESTLHNLIEPHGRIRLALWSRSLSWRDLQQVFLLWWWCCELFEVWWHCWWSEKVVLFSLCRWAVGGFLYGLVVVCVCLCRLAVLWPLFRGGFVCSSVSDLSTLTYCGRFAPLILVFCVCFVMLVGDLLCLLCFITLSRSKIWSLKKSTKFDSH